MANDIRDIIIKGVIEFNKWRDEQEIYELDLSGSCLSDLNLQAINFKNTLLRKADLSFAILNNAQFDGADLSGADLTNIKAKGASFIETYLIDTDFSIADLKSPTLDKIIYGSLDKDKETLWDGSCPRDIEPKNMLITPLTGDALLNAGDNLANVAYESVRNAPKDGAIFISARIKSLLFVDVDCRWATFKNSTIENLTGDGSDFTGSEFTDMNFRNSSLKKTIFCCSQFTNCKFIHCDFRGSYFDGACFTDSTFDSCDIRGANFSFSNLSDCKFENSDLRAAFFSKCDLKNITMRSSKLDKLNSKILGDAK